MSELYTNITSIFPELQNAAISEWHPLENIDSSALIRALQVLSYEYSNNTPQQYLAYSIAHIVDSMNLGNGPQFFIQVTPANEFAIHIQPDLDTANYDEQKYMKDNFLQFIIGKNRALTIVQTTNSIGGSNMGDAQTEITEQLDKLNLFRGDMTKFTERIVRLIVQNYRENAPEIDSGGGNQEFFSIDPDFFEGLDLNGI